MIDRRTFDFDFDFDRLPFDGLEWDRMFRVEVISRGETFFDDSFFSFPFAQWRRSSSVFILERIILSAVDNFLRSTSKLPRQKEKNFPFDAQRRLSIPINLDFSRFV